MKRLFTIPNLLSLSRLVFLPSLYILLWKGRLNSFFLTFSLIGSTDFLDGYLARKWNQVSQLGKNLDTIADMFFYISVAYFLFVLSPESIANNGLLLMIAFTIYGISFLVPFIKFGVPYTLHTRILRSNAVLVYAMMLLSMMLNPTYLLAVILIIFCIGFSEQILIFLRYGKVDQDTTSYFSLSFEKQLRSISVDSIYPKIRKNV